MKDVGYSSTINSKNMCESHDLSTDVKFYSDVSFRNLKNTAGSFVKRIWDLDFGHLWTLDLDIWTHHLSTHRVHLAHCTPAPAPGVPDPV